MDPVKCRHCNIVLRHKSSIARGKCTALASCAKRRAANMTVSGVKNAKSFLRNHSEQNYQHLPEQPSPDSTARDFAVGDAVEYHFCDTPNSWYPGIIAKVNDADGDISIDFNDGDSYADLPKYKRNASGINMVRHFSKKSAPTLPRCIRCGQTFKNTRGLKIHRARGCRPQSGNHDGCMIPRCITCGRVFKSLKGLRIHHGHGCSQKPNTPEINMELDIKQQKNTQSLRCDSCGRTFEKMKGLNIHLGHGCGAKKPERIVRIKTKSHTSANGLEAPSCGRCGRVFKNAKGLKIHRGHGCGNEPTRVRVYV